MRTGGTTNPGYNGDGINAKIAQLNGPSGIALDVSSDIYFADSSNHRIRMVSKKTSIITTIVGNGVRGYSGDNGPALLAQLNYPQSIFIDITGDIYVADSYNNRIRIVTRSTGIITSLDGNSYDYNYPTGIFIDISGDIYFANSGGGRIRMVSKKTKIITTIVANVFYGYNDGNGITNPSVNIALDISGNVYFTDNYDNAVRMLTKSTGLITTIATVYSPYGIDGSENLFVTSGDSTVVRISARDNPTAVPSFVPSAMPSFTSVVPNPSPSNPSLSIQISQVHIKLKSSMSNFDLFVKYCFLY